MIPIFEPGLEALVASNVEAGRLSFTTETAAIRSADAVFLAVGTPSRRGDGFADLSYVYDARARSRPKCGTLPSASSSRWYRLEPMTRSMRLFAS
jgi:UDPglucose 6-dehydrogenase